MFPRHAARRTGKAGWRDVERPGVFRFDLAHPIPVGALRGDPQRDRRAVLCDQDAAAAILRGRESHGQPRVARVRRSSTLRRAVSVNRPRMRAQTAKRNGMGGLESTSGFWAPESRNSMAVAPLIIRNDHQV